MTKSLWIKDSLRHTLIRFFHPVSLFIITLILLAVVLTAGRATGSFQKQFDKASYPALMRNGQHNSKHLGQQPGWSALSQSLSEQLEWENSPSAANQFFLFQNCASYAEQQKLSADDGGGTGQFGFAVAISGDTAVIGRPEDNIGANSRQGSAYVFVRTGSVWILQQKLIAPDGNFDDRFGITVAISGDTVLIGASLDDNGAIANQGSAYVFVRSGTLWSMQQKLTASDGAFLDNFGTSVAIDGDTAAIGARFDNPGTHPQQGSAYIFVRSGTTWSQQQKLIASDGDTDDSFGSTIAISGETVLVGAVPDDVGSNLAQGAAYVFVRNGTTWSEQQKLTTSDDGPGDIFGPALGLSGDTAVIGGSTNMIGTNANQGSAYIFVRNGTAWSQQQKLTAADGEASDRFGYAVAISGDTVMISVLGDTILPNFIRGSVYVFNRSGATWNQLQQFTTTDGLGAVSLAFDGGTAVAGTGGDFFAQGFAYVFNCSSCPPITLAPVTLPNITAGVPYSQMLTATGGAAPYSFAVSNGTLPSGLMLSPNGLLSGTSNTQIQYIFTVQATDNNGCTGFRTYALTVIPPCGTITIMPAMLPDGFTGNSYNEPLSATGGTFPYSFTLTTGNLPPGLSISSGGSNITGTPTATGMFSFAVKATDINGCIGIKDYTILIRPPCPSIFISPNNLPSGTVGTAYNQMLTQTGGVAPITWSVSSGSLPPGISLDAMTGAITGTPPTATFASFAIRATDANSCAAERSYGVSIGAGALQFYPLPRPVRLLDTRANQGNCDNVSAPIAAGTSLTTLARITCESITIPSTAQAITGNVTVLNNTNQTGYLTIYPTGQTAPVAANMVYGPGAILSNNFTVGLSSDGRFNIFGERTIDAVVDISGYYAPPGTGGLYYHTLPKPIRLLDTRAGEGNCDSVSTPIATGASLTTLARTTCESLTIPAAAQALVGNATVINISGEVGYLTIYPNGVPVPLAANMVYFPGQILSNAFTVSLSAGGEFNIFAERTIDMVMDVAGYYSNEAVDANGPGLLFTPLARPLRIMDTRAGEGTCDSVSAPITGNGSIAVPNWLTCESITIPNTARTVLGNVTVINLTPDAGYLTLYPDGVAQPLAANMVYFPGQILSNAFAVGVNTGTGQFRIFAERTLHSIVDVSGYFAP